MAKLKGDETNGNSEIQDTRPSNAARCCEGDESEPRGCKHPTPPFALAKILPETRQIENFSPFTKTLLFQQIFFVLVCIHPGTPRVPPLVLAYIILKLIFFKRVKFLENKADGKL